MIAGEHKQLHAAEPAIEIQEKWIKRDTKFWDGNAKKRKMHACRKLMLLPLHFLWTEGASSVACG